MAEFRGVTASNGYARGPAVVLSRGPVYAAETDHTPEEGARALRDAIDATLKRFRGIMTDADPQSVAIIEYQIALLEDEVLSAAAFEAVARGADPAVAWEATLDLEIAGLTAADDEYFERRVADLRDIKEQVLSEFSDRPARQEIASGSVVFAQDLGPSRFLEIDWSDGGGLVLGAGNALGHVAILARSRGIPLITGVGSIPFDLKGETIVDGPAATAIVVPSSAVLDGFERRRRAGEATAEPVTGGEARTRDGVAISILLNVAGMADASEAALGACDGIGLVRTEFLFGGKVPDEDDQLAYYVELLSRAKGKQVVIRVFDFGDDKPGPLAMGGAENNPALGMRGVRLLLQHQGLLRTQLRALARAAPRGDVRVLIPFVTHPGEMTAVRTMLAEEVANLSQAGMEAANPPLGMMVEVPGAALALEAFDADFFSLGTNDLVQFMTANARTGGARQADVTHPGVLWLIRSVAAQARKLEVPLTLCGEAASDPEILPAILRCGVTRLSVTGIAVESVRKAIANLDLGADTVLG